MAGSLVSVAGTGTAHAANLAASPASCAIYIQGPTDPQAGNLPPNLLPLSWSGQNYTVSGEVTSGDGSKIIANLRDTTALAKRFDLNVKINRTPVLEQIAANTAQALTVNATQLKLSWKNSSTGKAQYPTVQVAESGKLNAVATKVNAVKGTVVATGTGKETQGAALGNVQTAQFSSPIPDHSTQILQMNIARNVQSGNFKIQMNLPGVPPALSVTPNIAWNASDAVIKGNIDGVLGGILGVLAPTTAVLTTQTQTPSSVTLGPPITFITGQDRVIKISITSGTNPAFPTVNNPLLGRTLSYSVTTEVKTDLDANPVTPDVPTSKTLLPIDAIVSNGGIWNNNQTAGQIGGTGTYKGDPALGVITDLGNNPIPSVAPGFGGPGSENIYTANVVIANGTTGGTGGIANGGGLPNSNGVNTGKANYYPDATATVAIFSKGVITGINPNAAGNFAAVGLALSAAIPPATYDPSNQTCSLSSLLGLFCQADPDQIPAAFSSFCSALADPNGASPSSPIGVAGTTSATDGVDLSWTTPTYAVSGTDGGMGICTSGQCDVIDHYEVRASADGKTWGTGGPFGNGWVTIPGSNAGSTSAAVSKALINTGNPLCGILNKVCLYQVRAENGLGVASETPIAPVLIHGQPGTTANPGVKAK
jgi:hypothetical protein